MSGCRAQRAIPARGARAITAAIDDEPLRACAELERQTSRMRMSGCNALRWRSAIHDGERAPGHEALVARMRRMQKRLAADIVAREKCGDHPGVALAASVE